MFFSMIFLDRHQLSGRKIRQRSVRPDLTVRVRITRAQQLATIFENLHVVNPWNFSECGVLFAPAVNDSAQLRDGHSCNGEVVARRKTHHPADSLLRLSS